MNKIILADRTDTVVNSEENLGIMILNCNVWIESSFFQNSFDKIV